MKQKKLVPKRRLIGFMDEWNIRKFDEEIELYSGLTYSPNDVKKKGAFVLRSSNVKNGEIVDADNVYVNPEVVNSTIVKKGDIIVVVRNGSRSLIGKHALIKRRMDNTVIGAFMTGIRSDQPNFINALLDTERFKKEIEKNLGATINQITNGMFREMKFLFPEIKEQQKIGEFFNQLDQMITLEQRKLEKTKALKSAYLAEMFPAKGERVPKRRFAGFNDEWKQQKLNKVADYRSGKAHERNVVDIGEYIIVNSKFVSTNGRTRKYSNIQIEPLKKGELAFVLSDIPNGKALAKTFLIDRDNLFTLNQRIAGITPKENTDSYFLKELMNRHEYFLKFDGGVGQTNLSNADIENFESSYPSFDEQKRISNFFKQLEYKIMTQQQKLDKLKAMKQAYLQEMFV